MKTFRDAIFDVKIPVIRKLAAERPRLLQQSIDADGNTALGLALLLGEVEVVKTLLELGSNPNIANGFDGNHPLVIMAKLRAEENSKTSTLAQILLDAGSDPLYEVRYQADSANRVDATQTPSFHETPLLCCGKLFISYKKKSILSHLVRFQNEDLLKKMIEHRVDINTLNPETGTSPLMLAAALGYHRICNLLIDAGADLNAADHNGNTPLHLAIRGFGEQIPVIQTLIQRGANLNLKNEDGFTPAMLAKESGNSECLKLLTSQTDSMPAPPVYPDVGPVREEPKEQNIFSFT